MLDFLALITVLNLVLLVAFIGVQAWKSIRGRNCNGNN